jgi:uncharacterized membrane protein YccC
MNLSRTTKESIKTALAMTIAYGVGLSMGWERPYWAGFAVAFISLSSFGQSFNKGALRMSGTVMAAIVALTVIALTAQQRWVFMVLVSLWCGLCTYMMAGKKHQYFWHVSGFVFVIICVDGGPYPDNAFSTAMIRLQQTGLGILVYSVVALLLWPVNSGKQMASCACSLVDSQAKLFNAYLHRLMAEDGDDSVKELYAQVLQEQNQFAALLDAAATDTEEVHETKEIWQQFYLASSALNEAMQRWQENTGDLQRLSLQNLLPGLDNFNAELKSRLEAVKQLLQNEAYSFNCSDINLEADTKALQELSHFHRAALLVARDSLLAMERLTRRQFESMRMIRSGGALPKTSSHEPKQPRFLFIPDPDRLLAAGRVMTALWLAFLCVVYIGDFPGGFGFVSMCTALAMALMTMPQLPITLTYVPTAIGILLGGFLYIFVMPHLTSFTGLGLMIFLATFYLCYRYAAPQQMLNRALGLAMMVTLISVSNQQSYHFLSVASTALMFTLLYLLLTIVSYLPYSPRPERTMLRLLKRYFFSSSFLLSQPRQGTRSRLAAWREAFHRQEVATLPAKLKTWSAHADPVFLGSESVQNLPEMISRLEALSYRQQELLDVRALPQSTVLEEALAESVEAWRQRVLAAMQLMSSDPSRAGELARKGLDERLASVEQRVAEALNDASIEQTDREYQENFYRLLGAYRGTSLALLDFAELAVTVDWNPWFEERFA